MQKSRFKINASVLYALLAILGAISCSPNADLNISDLKFTNLDRMVIAANRIDTMYIIVKNRILAFNVGDTVGYVTYDKEGRIIFDGSNPDLKYRYEYDSSGISKSGRVWESDVGLIFVDEYKFEKNIFLLLQSRTFEDGHKYKSRFFFNPNGYLISKCSDDTEYDFFSLLTMAEINKIHLVRTGTPTDNQEFKYDSLERLVKVNEMIECSSKEGLETLSESIYYYNADSNIPDSIVTEYSQFKFERIIYYNDKGLRNHAIYNDTLNVVYKYSHSINGAD